MSENPKKTDSVFRKKSLDYFADPEQSTDYLHLPTAGAVILLVSGLVLAAGAVIWMLLS